MSQKSLIHVGGCLTQVGLERLGLALDTGGRVGCISILVGRLKALVSNCLPVGMFSASLPCPLNFSGFSERALLNELLHVARITQLGVSFLILY